MVYFTIIIALVTFIAVMFYFDYIQTGRVKRSIEETKVKMLEFAAQRDLKAQKRLQEMIQKLQNEVQELKEKLSKKD